MEAREFLNQKRIGLVNKFYYQVLEIKKNGAEPFHYVTIIFNYGQMYKGNISYRIQT